MSGACGEAVFRRLTAAATRGKGDWSAGVSRRLREKKEPPGGHQGRQAACAHYVSSAFRRARPSRAGPKRGQAPSEEAGTASSEAGVDSPASGAGGSTHRTSSIAALVAATATSWASSAISA